MVKVPVVPAGNSSRGKTFQFVQKRHREAYKVLTKSQRPTERTLKALSALGADIDYGEDADDRRNIQPVSTPSPQ